MVFLSSYQDFPPILPRIYVRRNYCNCSNFYLCKINITTNIFLWYIISFIIKERDQVANSPYSYFSLTKSTDNLKSKVNEDIAAIQREIQAECIETDTKKFIQFVRENWHSAYRIPHIPALSKPGWLLRFTIKWWQNFESFSTNIVRRIGFSL